MSSLGFFVSGGGLAFRAVVEAMQGGVLPQMQVTLLTDRPSTAVGFARSKGIAAYQIEHDSCSNAEEFDEAMLDVLKSRSVEWGLLNFNRLIKPRVLNGCETQFVNLHLSLLPLFPGFGAVAAALKSGMKTAGVTFHFVDDTVDGGTIIAQAVMGILPNETKAMLTAGLYQLAVPLQIQICRWISRDQLQSHGPWQPQQTGLTSLNFFPSIDEDILEFSTGFLSKTSGFATLLHPMRSRQG